MPWLIRTPEDIFRAEKKDLYVIHDIKERERFKRFFESPAEAVSEPDDERDGAWLEMMRKWIEDTLPGTRMETMGPSEHSGFLAGGPTGLRVDFSDEGLERFVARWEDGNDKSLDPRFQCYIYPYDRWYQRHGRFVPTRERPAGPGKTVWWYTPQGFIHHQLTQEDELSLEKEWRERSSHPATHRDIWMHTVESWPKDFAALDTDTLTHGRVFRSRENAWEASWVKPWRMARGAPCVPTPEEIRDWFKLPPDAPVHEADF